MRWYGDEHRKVDAEGKTPAHIVSEAGADTATSPQKRLTSCRPARGNRQPGARGKTEEHEGKQRSKPDPEAGKA